MSNPSTTVGHHIHAEPTADVISLGIFLGLMTVITVGGNLLVILAVCLVKKLRTPSNFLIVSLAVSDLLVGLIAMPFAEFKQLVGSWTLGEALCDMYIAFDVLLCTASILNLCAISIDRYLAITRPLQYAAKRTPKRMTLMIASVWVASALISIPPMFGFKETFIPGFCEYSSNFIYQIYATCGAFYIPLIVMIVLYGRIFILARRMAQEDAKQKRVTDSVANQNYSSTYASRNGRPSTMVSDDFKINGEPGDLFDGSVARTPSFIMTRPITISHIDELKSMKCKAEKYPLPPSELCRRRKPRQLFRETQPQEQQPLHTQSQEPPPLQQQQQIQADCIKKTESAVKQSLIAPGSQSPSGLSCAEEFGERVRALRKLRAEFFAAPPSRHCSSVILNFRRDSSLSNDTGVRPTFTVDHSDSTNLNEHRSPLHHSYTMREPATKLHTEYRSHFRSSMPPPPKLSISYYSDAPSVIVSPSQGSEALTSWTTVEPEKDHPPDPLTTRSEPHTGQLLLRPKPRPLHGTRRSMTNAADYANKDFQARCSMLGLPSHHGDRRCSTPIAAEPYGWGSSSAGTATCDSPCDRQPSYLERSASRLFHRTSDHALLPPARSRAASWASIRVPLRKRRGRGHSETKAIKTLGVIMGCFCLCWVPFFIIALARPMHKVVTGEDLPVPPVVDSLFLWLGYINSTINPIIYAIFNREFRIPFKEILICRCRGINARLRSQRFAVEYGGTAASTASGMGTQYGPNDTGGSPLPNANMLNAKRRSNSQAHRNTLDYGNNHIGSSGRLNTDSLNLPVGYHGRRPSNLLQR